MLLLGVPPEETPTPQNPGVEHTEYEVRYLYGAINARAASAFFDMKPDIWEGKEVNTLNISIRVKSIFRLFLKDEYAVEGQFTRPGMKPLYYYCPSSKGEGWCRYTEGDEGVHYWRFFEKMPAPESFIYPNDGRTMEMMSLLYFARTYDFQEGVPCEVKVLIGGKPYRGTITWEGTDLERYPGHQAQRLRLVLTERGIMENGSGNEVVLWREAEGARIILGMYVPLGKKGTMVANIVEDSLGNR